MSRLPDHWSKSTVGELAASIQYGYTASASFDVDGPKFLRITDIQGGQVGWAGVPSCEIKGPDVDKYRLRDGDIVFARTGATTGKSYLIKNAPSAVFASYLIRLRMAGDLDPAYLAYFFQTLDYWRQIERGKRGIGQPNVNAKTLSRIEIPVAPSDQQGQIVAKIDELFSDLDAGVAALERARNKLKRYGAAVLKAAVEGKLTEQWRAENPSGEPASALLERILAERRRKWEEEQLKKYEAKGERPPKGWRERYKEPRLHEQDDLPELPSDWHWISLGTVAWDVKDGPHYSPKYAEEGIPFISGRNVRPEGIDFSTAKYITPELHEELSARCKPEYGDLLYTKGGTTGIARINWETTDFNVWVHVAVLKLVSSVEPDFLQHVLNSPFCYAQAQRYTHGVGNQDLGLTRMVKIALPLPPLNEQREIVRVVDEQLSVVNKSQSDLEVSLARVSRLRQGILKRAFKGQLLLPDVPGVVDQTEVVLTS